MANDIDTAPKRSRLEPRKNPFWASIGGSRGGLSLGYRKPARGPGSWVAKIISGGARVEEKIGPADDAGAPSGALSYRAAVAAALEWNTRQEAALEAHRKTLRSVKVLTVATAVQEYGEARRRRSAASAANARSRLGKHVLGDARFAAVPLAKLQAGTIHEWRGRLAAGAENVSRPVPPSTLNRILNDLRAALNAALETHRRQLPAGLAIEIRLGTRAAPVAEPARRQLLSDAQVRAAIEAAFAIEEDGTFGRVVALAAATGARYSQLAKMTVGDFQPDLGRVMVPGSQKGRAAYPKPPVAVPLSKDVLARLEPATKGRALSDPLLTRWAFRNTAPFRWERDRLRALGAAEEIQKQWAQVVELAALPPGTIFYALRHSSIVRGLRAGLPVRLVASLHDTSVEMIERHYGAFIVDMTEDLARRAALQMVPEDSS